MKEEYLKGLGKKTGINMAYKVIAETNYPTHFDIIKEIKDRLTGIIEEDERLTPIEREGVYEGINCYFSEYSSQIRDFYRDVV